MWSCESLRSHVFSFICRRFCSDGRTQRCSCYSGIGYYRRHLFTSERAISTMYAPAALLTRPQLLAAAPQVFLESSATAVHPLPSLRRRRHRIRIPHRATTTSEIAGAGVGAPSITWRTEPALKEPKALSTLRSRLSRRA